MSQLSPEQILAGLTEQKIAALDRDIQAMTGAIRTRDVQMAALSAANEQAWVQLQSLTAQRDRLNGRFARMD